MREEESWVQNTEVEKKRMDDYRATAMLNEWKWRWSEDGYEKERMKPNEQIKTYHVLLPTVSLLQKFCVESWKSCWKGERGESEVVINFLKERIELKHTKPN